MTSMLAYANILTDNSVDNGEGNMTRKRLTSAERKEEILNISLRVFSEKGYKNTSMRDLVNATGLSAGGLYHHYKSTAEILYDLMLQGCVYRENKITESLRELTEPLSARALAKIIVDKALDSNPFIPVYVMFLQSMQEDEQLLCLYQKLRERSIGHLTQMLTNHGYRDFSEETWTFINDFINTLILGCETLGVRQDFVSKRLLLENIMVDVLKENRKEID